MTSDVTRTPDMSVFEGFLADRRAKHGDLRMDAAATAPAAADASAEAAAESASPDGTASADSAASTTSTDDAAGKETGKTGPPSLDTVAGLSPEQKAEVQKVLDALAGKVRGETTTRLTAAHKAELEAQAALAGKSESEVATLLLQQEQARTAALAERLVAAEAKSALVAANIAVENYDAVLKLTDLPKAENGEPDVDAIAAAITATLDKYPVFKPQVVVETKETGKPGAPIVPSPGATVGETGAETGGPATLADAISAFYRK